MNDDILKYLSDTPPEEQRIMSDDMATRKAKASGDYKYACGIIRGLLIANNAIIETAERLNKADD